MTGGVLRPALLVVGLGFLAGAVILAKIGCIELAWRLGFFGVVLAVAGLVERWRYKRLAATRPGTEWVATGERFVDPESGKLVSVYFHPRSGERRYVAAEA
jgi:hypothetical protein